MRREPRGALELKLPAALGTERNEPPDKAPRTKKPKGEREERRKQERAAETKQRTPDDTHTKCRFCRRSRRGRARQSQHKARPEKGRSESEASEGRNERNPAPEKTRANCPGGESEADETPKPAKSNGEGRSPRQNEKRAIIQNHCFGCVARGREAAKRESKSPMGAAPWGARQ